MSRLWENQKHPDRVFVPNDTDPTGRMTQQFSFTSNSLSGKERNRLFLRRGQNFSDVTLVSGADDLADGRSFAIVDFDQDGWLDIALMSLNFPRFKLYRNEMKTLYPENSSMQIRLVGGASSADADEGWSNRDAIGARVLVQFESGRKLAIQKQCGEGFASQNSETLSVGVPAGDAVSSLTVNWPSGKTTSLNSPNPTAPVLIKETGN